MSQVDVIERAILDFECYDETHSTHHRIDSAVRVLLARHIHDALVAQEYVLSPRIDELYVRIARAELERDEALERLEAERERLKAFHDVARKGHTSGLLRGRPVEYWVGLEDALLEIADRNFSSGSPCDVARKALYD